MGGNQNRVKAVQDRLADELTDLAYPMAVRQGVEASSVDVELDVWKAIRGVLQEIPLPCPPADASSQPVSDEALARLTEGVYQAVLRRGFRGPFTDLELGLWQAFRSWTPAAWRRRARA